MYIYQMYVHVYDTLFICQIYAYVYHKIYIYIKCMSTL